MKKAINLFAALISSILLASSATSAWAQAKIDLAVNQADTKIASLLEAISKGLAARDNGDYDQKALSKADDAMVEYMKQACKSPVLLTANLKKAKDAGLTIAASDDKKMRIYSWDTQSGGSMRFFNAIAQFQPSANAKETQELMLYPSGKQKASDGDIESGYSYDTIKKMHTSDGKTIYFAFGLGVYSGQDSGVVVQAYQITNNGLTKVAVFKTKTETLDEISCNFHNRNSDLIKLDEKNNKLSVPLLKGEGETTGKYLVYVFDGHKFVYKNVEGSLKKPAKPN